MMSTRISRGDFPVAELNDDLCYFYNFVDCGVHHYRSLYKLFDDGNGVLQLSIYNDTENQAIRWGNNTLVLSMRWGSSHVRIDQDHGDILTLYRSTEEITITRIIEKYHELIDLARVYFTLYTRVNNHPTKRTVMGGGRFI